LKNTVEPHSFEPENTAAYSNCILSPGLIPISLSFFNYRLFKPLPSTHSN